MTITACFFPLRRLLGPKVAAFATLFIAWTPFHIALSRQLHPDGLSSSLIFLALLTFLAWLYGDGEEPSVQEKTRFLSVDVYLILSGIIMGLAWLTKTPAIFLVPIGAALGHHCHCHLCPALAGHVARAHWHIDPHGNRDERLCEPPCKSQLLHGPADQRSWSNFLPGRVAFS